MNRSGAEAAVKCRPSLPLKERLNKGWNWGKEAWRFAQ